MCSASQIVSHILRMWSLKRLRRANVYAYQWAGFKGTLGHIVWPNNLITCSFAFTFLFGLSFTVKNLRNVDYLTEEVLQDECCT